MNYEDMSDFEINKAVSYYVDFGDLIVSNNDSEVYLLESDGLFSVVQIAHFDPCNNPSDAWPIIVENKLSIEPHATKDTYFSATRHCEFNCQDKNPLRAAMICFLKMKDAENDR